MLFYITNLWEIISFLAVIVVPLLALWIYSLKRISHEEEVNKLQQVAREEKFAQNYREMRARLQWHEKRCERSGLSQDDAGLTWERFSEVCADRLMIESTLTIMRIDITTNADLNPLAFHPNIRCDLGDKLYDKNGLVFAFEEEVGAFVTLYPKHRFTTPDEHRMHLIGRMNRFMKQNEAIEPDWQVSVSYITGESDKKTPPKQILSRMIRLLEPGIIQTPAEIFTCAPSGVRTSPYGDKSNVVQFPGLHERQPTNA